MADFDLTTTSASSEMLAGAAWDNHAVEGQWASASQSFSDEVAVPGLTSYYVIGTRGEITLGPTTSAPMLAGSAYDPIFAPGEEIPGIWASAPIPELNTYYIQVYRPILDASALPTTQTTYSWG